MTMILSKNLLLLPTKRIWKVAKLWHSLGLKVRYFIFWVTNFNPYLGIFNNESFDWRDTYTNKKISYDWEIYEHFAFRTCNFCWEAVKEKPTDENPWKIYINATIFSYWGMVSYQTSPVDIMKITNNTLYVIPTTTDF